MGKYMTVVLKEQYKNDKFIHALNDKLPIQYGSNVGVAFNTWQSLQEEANYLNNHSEGKKQAPDLKRPVTKEMLHEYFFWLRMGEFSFKLSGEVNSDVARDAIAICKWIIKTRGKYIDKTKSSNFSPAMVKKYLNILFEEDGYILEKLWELPQNE